MQENDVIIIVYNTSEPDALINGVNLYKRAFADLSNEPIVILLGNEHRLRRMLEDLEKGSQAAKTIGASCFRLSVPKEPEKLQLLIEKVLDQFDRLDTSPEESHQLTRECSLRFLIFRFLK